MINKGEITKIVMSQVKGKISWEEQKKLLDSIRCGNDEALIKLYSVYEDVLPMIGSYLSDIIKMDKDDIESIARVTLFDCFRNCDDLKRDYLCGFVYCYTSEFWKNIALEKLSSFGVSSASLIYFINCIEKVEKEYGCSISSEDTEMVNSLYELVVGSLITYSCSIEKFKRILRKFLSEDEVVQDDLDLVDNYSVSDCLYQVTLEDKIEKMFKEINPKVVTILKKYYGFGEDEKTLGEIAKEYKVSDTMIGMYISRGLKRMRAMAYRSGLNELYYK